MVEEREITEKEYKEVFEHIYKEIRELIDLIEHDQNLRREGFEYKQELRKAVKIIKRSVEEKLLQQSEKKDDEKTK